MRAVRNKKARGRKISGIEPMPGEDKVTFLVQVSFLFLQPLYYNFIDSFLQIAYSLFFFFWIFLSSNGHVFPISCLGSYNIK